MLHKMKRSYLRMSVLLLFVATASLLVWGCGGGGDSYDEPASSSDIANTPAVGGAATSVLIEPATFKDWIDQGLIGNESGYGPEVVLIDLASEGDRIPGACRINLGAELTAQRFEGVGDANPMVATGAQMDALIQRLGIDEETIVVFAAPGNIYAATRAYFTFRYWGFPKDRLKVLNGGIAAFAEAYPELMTDEVPTATPSNYSVRNLEGINADLRASMGEMITILEDGLVDSTTNLVLDARGKDPADGDSGYFGTSATPGKLPDYDGPVVFDGHPAGGEYLNYSWLLNSAKTAFAAPEDSDMELAEYIASQFEAKGWQEGMKTTVYCTSAYSATPLFFALDAILDVETQLYDGSWSQFGKYSDYAEAGGELPIGSLWAVDQFMDPETLTYNRFNLSDPSEPSPITVDEALAQDNPFSGDDPDSDSDTVPSQIEVADEAAAPGGGGTAFVEPSETFTPNVLIDPDKLMNWEDLVNADFGDERVVILDVSSPDAYAEGHIPGAVNWDRSIRGEDRYEGPIAGVNMVLSAETFEDQMQAAGIDEDTTIVITSAEGGRTEPSRIYFHFRYWGFPKERLKMLNGYNAVWPDGKLTTDETVVVASDLTLAELETGADTQVRASLSEMMDAARDFRGVPVDFRGDSSEAGATGGAVFNGIINNGKYLDRNTYFDESGRYLSRGEMISLLADNDIVVNDFSADGSYEFPALPYCTKGNLGAYGYFIFDAILNVDTMLYDASWSQWGALSDNDEKDGVLADYGLEAWAVDSATYMSEVNYGLDALGDVEPLNPDADALTLDPSEANQIEKADDDYQTTPPADSSGSDSDGASTANDDGPQIGC